MSKTLFLLLGTAILSTTLIVGQSTSRNGVTEPTKTNDTLTSSERVLVDGSKQAIISTGISEKYFATHFKLLKVSDKPGDLRVVWEFSVNGHVTVINDAVGYYSEGSKRIYTHSASKALGRTSDIDRTLTRARALRIMKSCIGNFTNPSVVYGPVDGQAALFLVAQALRPNEAKRGEHERDREREKEKEEAGRRKADAAGTDLVEEEETEERPKIVFGNVNLQTGKCTKGAGVVAKDQP